jgi:hypothetical protein
MLRPGGGSPTNGNTTATAFLRLTLSRAPVYEISEPLNATVIEVGEKLVALVAGQSAKRRRDRCRTDVASLAGPCFLAQRDSVENPFALARVECSHGDRRQPAFRSTLADGDGPIGGRAMFSLLNCGASCTVKTNI